MDIETNFVEDIRLGLTAELAELGYTVPEPQGDAHKDAHDVCVAHWNAHLRRIRPRPRAVHRSAELGARELALAPAIRRGLDAVEREMRAGEDMSARLSRQLNRIAFKDMMMNDWGLHHLHLDEVNPAAGTREVLILLVRDADAYFVDVLPHDHWADQDLVEILHANWPGAVARHRQDQVVALSHKLSDDQHKHLRRNGWNAPVQTRDRSVYMAIGGGFAHSGDNIGAVRWADWLLGNARVVEEFLQAHQPWLADSIEELLGERLPTVRVRLWHLKRDKAILAVKHNGKEHRFSIPIEVPPRIASLK